MSNVISLDAVFASCI